MSRRRKQLGQAIILQKERERQAERERAAVLRERESKCERVRESRHRFLYTDSEKLSPRSRSSSSNNCDLQIYCEFILIVILLSHTACN